MAYGDSVFGNSSTKQNRTDAFLNVELQDKKGESHKAGGIRLSKSKIGAIGSVERSVVMAAEADLAERLEVYEALTASQQKKVEHPSKISYVVTVTASVNLTPESQDSEVIEF
jgi:hypothetical protein